MDLCRIAFLVALCSFMRVVEVMRVEQQLGDMLDEMEMEEDGTVRPKKVFNVFNQNGDETQVPKACTWNAGGGGPAPEFLGPSWMVQPSPVGTFWDEAEKRIGSAVLQLVGGTDNPMRNLGLVGKKGYDFARYLPGNNTEGTLALKGLPGNNTEGTVGQLLSGLPEFAKADGLDMTKWKCYENLPLTKVFQHAWGLRSVTDLFSEEGCDDSKYELLPQRTFKSPDGCFNHRQSKFATGAIFNGLLAASSDAEYWKLWVKGMVTSKLGGPSKWGPSNFCSVAELDASIKETMTEKPQSNHEADWIAMAIWDRFIVSITKEEFLASTSLKTNDLSTISEPDEKTVAADIIGKIRFLTTLNNVLMLQEPPDSTASEFAKTHDVFGSDAVVMVKKKEWMGWPGLDEGQTNTATQKLRELQKAYAKQWAEGHYKEHKAAKKAKKFFVTAAAAYMSAAVADGILFVSVHSDTDGFFCKDALGVAQELAASMDLPALVGIDSNVQRFPKAPQNGLRDLLTAASALGFLPIQPKDIVEKKKAIPITYTVWKVRSLVQAQIHKAAKVDKIIKDWLFWYPGKKGVKMTGKAKMINEFKEVSFPRRIFKGKWKASFKFGRFPTKDFFADHAVVMTR